MGLKADSTWITARTRSAATPWRRECSLIEASYGALFGLRVSGVVARTVVAPCTS